jgi:hypothetical protein
MVGQDMHQCVDTFPACDLTVGEAEHCMRRQRVDACYQLPESERCRDLRQCLWGIVELPAAGRCDVAQHRWTVAVTARSWAARARLLKRVPAESALCQGLTIYYESSGWELKAMFGRHLELRGVAGAGNSMESCGWFEELTPPDFVPAAFAPDATAVALVTDAKSALLAEPRPCP